MFEATWQRHVCGVHEREIAESLKFPHEFSSFLDRREDLVHGYHYDIIIYYITDLRLEIIDALVG